MTTPDRNAAVPPRPSAALDAATWGRAHDQLTGNLRDLLRIRTVNPPGDEILAARLLEAVLADAGIPSTVVEPFPGRGSIVARLRGDGTGGAPLLLLSHLDVVPAPEGGWTHDPFGGDLADGYVWGRGAVDMKGMVAMEVAVMRLLAAEACAAGRDPGSDPVPGLTRDVIFASTADEEAGGIHGAGWMVEHHPDWLAAAGALNECGGVAVTVAGTRLWPIQVAEKGFAIYDLEVRGRWGHGSMPGDGGTGAGGTGDGGPGVGGTVDGDTNALLRAGEVARRLATPGPPRLTPVMACFLDGAADAVPAGVGAWIRRLAGDGPAADAALDALCTDAYRRALRSMLRDTFSPNVLQVGTRHNVIPGVAALTVDIRVLPGTSPDDVAAQLRARIGDDLAPHVTSTLRLWGPQVEAPAEGELWDVMTSAIRAADPAGIPLPAMATWATDAKHTAKLGIPTYGFSPLLLGPDDQFLALFHGDDERVSVEALRFGLPVLYDVVRRFCA
jgi:acetylornithine deacetylase/succinyl-diaminopimelate desuccinylase-like protein